MTIENIEGYKLNLSTIHQCETYSGVMLGETEMVNKFILDNIKKCYLPSSLDSWPFYITDIKKYKKEIKIELPKIATCALFSANQGTDNGKSSNSSLVVFWFQDAFFNEISQIVINEIQKLDWKRLAKNWEW